MNHDQIEIEYVTDDQNPSYDRVIERFEDRRGVTYDIYENANGIRIHTKIGNQHNARTVPWHRIHEIRYNGER